jgi:hypothetical protein
MVQGRLRVASAGSFVIPNLFTLTDITVCTQNIFSGMVCVKYHESA